MTPWDALGWTLVAGVVIALVVIVVALIFVARFIARLEREDRGIGADIDDQREHIRRQRERFKL